MSCSYLSDLSQQIWDQLGQPSSIAVSYIQSRLVSDAYLGQLNNLTQVCFSGISGYITPPLSPDEQAIYASLYVRDYYTAKLNQTLNGTDLGWTTLREGDSQITRVSAVEQAKVYKDMSRQLNDQLQYLVAAYRTNPIQARSVDYLSFFNGYTGPC